ncbi:hypothetical protein HQ487_00345 [Candidatus Uhrbacteria bacterium]|nr:hypothetical protein [Candidatus Uhrbacteria bacterium]
MTVPFSFVWPDPQEPRIIVRDLTVLRNRRRRKKGEPKIEPLVLTGAKLIELIPHCLYEVPMDCHELAKDVRELRPGSILSRNMKVSERLSGGPIESQVDQCFQSFDGVFKARRGLGKIDRRYRSREIPANKKLAGTLDELMKYSWELRKVDEEGQSSFVLIAVRAAKAYGKPIDETKVMAQQRTLQAGSVIDSIGRFNPGRIPLICFAGENKVASRIQAVRGIGRRMSFREVVLEHYIDRLHEISRDVSRSQEHRLRGEWLVPLKRTPNSVRKEAGQIEFEAQRLRAIVSRPFSRSFNRCADDLDEAAQLLRQAATASDGQYVDQSKDVIGRVYRAMIQMDCHRRLEEVLLQVGILEDRKQDIGASEQLMYKEELLAIHRRLAHVDPRTARKLEHGFKRPVLPRVLPRIHLAVEALMRKLIDGGPDLKTMQTELKLACAPL